MIWILIAALGLIGFGSLIGGMIRVGNQSQERPVIIQIKPAPDISTVTAFPRCGRIFDSEA